MMTRIRCRDHRCAFNKRGICTTTEIEYDPDSGCLTMEPREKGEKEEKKIGDEELEEELEDEDEEEDDDEEDEDEEDWDENKDEDWEGQRRPSTPR